jgi:hypothetical protein
VRGGLASGGGLSLSFRVGFELRAWRCTGFHTGTNSTACRGWTARTGQQDEDEGQEKWLGSRVRGSCEREVGHGEYIQVFG